MSSLAAMRRALADACASVGLNATGYITDDINTPAAVIARTQVDYDQTLGRGSDQFGFTIRVYVDRTDEIAGQQLLDMLVEPGTSSTLKTAIETQSVFDAAGVHFFRVRTASEVQVTQLGQIGYLTVEFDLEVMV